jgi:hypothetical protein
MRTNGKNPPWTAEEDAVVLAMTAIEAVKKLEGRTRRACNTRRNALRHLEPKPTNSGARWTAEECKILRVRYPTAEDCRDLVPFLPRFTPTQIRSKASHMGLRRKFCGDSDVPIDGHRELIDQIRIRAKQDGIALGKIDKLLKLPGKYFKENWKRQKRVNLRAVARALEFFGGSLVIDWRDR